MQSSIVRMATAFFAAAIIGGCGPSDGSSAPTAPNDPIVPRPTNPPSPPILGTYDRITPSSFGASRYVLYQDSSFALEYAVGRYLGRFTRADSVVRFNFSNLGPIWVATAILRGDVMAVQYNSTMAFSDFEDGDYLREH